MLFPRRFAVALWWALGALVTDAAGSRLKGIGTPLAASFFHTAALAYRSVESTDLVLYDGIPGGCGHWGDECDGVGSTTMDFVAVASRESGVQDASHLLQFPLLVAAVVPAYHVPDCAADLELTITVALLGEIHAGHITQWAHPALLALNPDLVACAAPVNASISFILPDPASPAAQVWREAQTGQSVDPRGAAATITNLTAATDDDTLRLLRAIPGSLGVVALPAALPGNVRLARIQVGGFAVAPSVGSVMRAADQLVSAVGDIVNASAVVDGGAWPLSAPLWLILRGNGDVAHCEALRATISFCRWLWESDTASALASQVGFAPLPYDSRRTMVVRLGQSLRCNGTLAWQPEVSPAPLTASCPGALGDMGRSVAEAYNALRNNDGVVFSDDTDNSTTDLSLQLAIHAEFPPSLASFFLGSVNLVVLSSHSVAMDVETLCGILDGTIQSWGDPKLMALNPGGIMNGDGKPVTQAISLLKGPAHPSALLADLLTPSCPLYRGAAWAVAASFPSQASLWAAMCSHPWALTIVPRPNRLPSELQVVSLQASPAATPTPPTLPLVVGLYLTLSASLCAAADGELARVLAFAGWFLSPPVLPTAVLQLGATLATADQQQANAAQLAALTCGVTRTAGTGESVNWIAILAALPGLLACSLLAFFLCVRRARVQQAPDVVVAEECCEAIAMLDLDALAWLETLPNPDRVQASFIRIVQVLRRIKPFIPDQLLMALRVGDYTFGAPSPEEVVDVPAANAATTPTTCSPSTGSLSTARVPGIIRTSSNGTVTTVHPQHLHCTPFVAPDSMEEEDTTRSNSGGSPRHLQPLSRFLSALGGRQTSYTSAFGRRASHISSTESFRTRTVSITSLPMSPSHNGRLLPGLQQGAVTGAPQHRLGWWAHQAGWEQRSFTEMTRRFSEGPLNEEWLTRRTAYMVVRFGFDDPPSPTPADSQAALQNLRNVVAMVIRVAKANKATVDHVTLGSVTLHWGMACPLASTALHAVITALDIRREVEPPLLLDSPLRPSFWLHVAVGCGLCASTTVTSANHRFFVLDGPEVALAHEICQSGIASKVKCTLLISHAVRQEVHCAVHSLPRALLNGALLWEPIRVLNAEGVANAEWMYQLDQLMADGEWTGMALREVFTMVQRGARRGEVEVAVEALRAQYESLMSPQDLASIDHLLSTLPPETPLPPPPVSTSPVAFLATAASAAPPSIDTDSSDAEAVDKSPTSHHHRRKRRVLAAAPGGDHRGQP